MGNTNKEMSNLNKDEQNIIIAQPVCIGPLNVPQTHAIREDSDALDFAKLVEMEIEKKEAALVAAFNDINSWLASPYMVYIYAKKLATEAGSDKSSIEQLETLLKCREHRSKFLYERINKLNESISNCLICGHAIKDADLDEHLIECKRHMKTKEEEFKENAEYYTRQLLRAKRKLAMDKSDVIRDKWRKFVNDSCNKNN